MLCLDEDEDVEGSEEWVVNILQYGQSRRVT
jgi:hypothetical protein